jgi:hypothetical protein
MGALLAKPTIELRVCLVCDFFCLGYCSTFVCIYQLVSNYGLRATPTITHPNSPSYFFGKLRKISLQQLPIPTTHLWQLGKKTHQLGILASGEALRILTPIARRRLFPRA